MIKGFKSFVYFTDIHVGCEDCVSKGKRYSHQLKPDYIFTTPVVSVKT